MNMIEICHAHAKIGGVDENIKSIRKDNIFLLDQKENSNDKREVIYCMRMIIQQIHELLLKKNKCNKYKISYLLMAFHNLPRALMNKESESFFGIGVTPISKEEAIVYASFYIEKTSECANSSF